MENVPLIFLASARRPSDTEAFMRQVFREGEYGLVDLLGQRVAPFNYDHAYPSDDGFISLVHRVLEHRAVVFATPVYWYAMSGLLKVFFDRLTDLVTVHKPLGRKLKGKALFLLAVGDDPELPDGFEVPFARTALYLDMHYGGALYRSTGREAPMLPDTDALGRFRDTIGSVCRGM